MKQVFIFLAEGFEDIEAITPIDLLRRAEIEVTTVSITSNREVKSAHNVTILADKIFDECSFTQNDYLVLPGGMPGTSNLAAHKGLNELLVTQHEKKKAIAAICAAPSILGNLGLLEGKNATCYPGFEEKLFGAHYTASRMEKADNLLTSKGPATAIDFALKIVKDIQGEDIATNIAKAIMYV